MRSNVSLSQDLFFVFEDIFQISAFLLHVLSNSVKLPSVEPRTNWTGSYLDSLCKLISIWLRDDGEADVWDKKTD